MPTQLRLTTNGQQESNHNQSVDAVRMSIGLVFAATDGVLVVADGREVAVSPEGGDPEWVTDRARKIMVAAEGAPLVAVGVGLVSVQQAGAEQDVLNILRDITDSPRPAYGLAAGAGPWTAKALTYQGKDLIDDDAGSFQHHRVLALAVDWAQDSQQPELWKLVVGSPEVDGIQIEPDEDDPTPAEGMTLVRSFASASQIHSFPPCGVHGIPDAVLGDHTTPKSEVWQLIRDHVDSTSSLIADEQVGYDDDAWLNTYKFAGQNLTTVRREVESALRQLVVAREDAFRRCHVGGYWLFAQLRRGRPAAIDEPVPIGPMHTQDGW